MKEKTIDGFILAEDDNRIPVDDPGEIPEFATDEEESEFWKTHTLSERFWKEAPTAPKDAIPNARARGKQ